MVEKAKETTKKVNPSKKKKKLTPAKMNVISFLDGAGTKLNKYTKGYMRAKFATTNLTKQGWLDLIKEHKLTK